MKKIIALVAIALTLGGCASVPKGSDSSDNAAKQFVAPTDAAAVYVYRNESLGRMTKMSVDIDGKSIGQTARETYLYAKVAPGKHVITSKAENTDSIEIDAKPGALYFVWQEVKWGVVSARNKLHLVDEEKGKKGVEDCDLAIAK